MQHHQKKSRIPALKHRHGIAIVEGSIVLSLILLVLLGALDMCLALVRHHEICRAAQKVARYAQVRGELAQTADGVWGPTAYTGTAADNSKYAKLARECLLSTPHQKVNMAISWPANNCQEFSPIRVELSYTYEPLIPLLWFNQNLSFHTASVMQVAH